MTHPIPDILDADRELLAEELDCAKLTGFATDIRRGTEDLSLLKAALRAIARARTSAVLAEPAGVAAPAGSEADYRGAHAAAAMVLVNYGNRQEPLSPDPTTHALDVVMRAIQHAHGLGVETLTEVEAARLALPGRTS